MIRTRLQPLLIVAMLALLGAAHAQEAQPMPAATDELPPRYTVEVIIFRYTQNVSGGNEVFVEPQAAVSTSTDVADANAANSAPSVDDATQVPDPALTTALGIVPTPNDQLTMGGVQSKLGKVDAYKPLMHFGWTQSVLSMAQTPALPLRQFANPPAGLDGNLTLYLSRFLHLVVDLSLLAPDADSAQQPDATNVDSNYADPGSGLTPLPLHYRIDEDRIFKSGDLRYFDHPKFGALVKITRAGAK